jgi:hypothetical protein
LGVVCSDFIGAQNSSWLWNDPQQVLRWARWLDAATGWTHGSRPSGLVGKGLLNMDRNEVSLGAGPNVGEGVGESFDAAALLQARQRSRQAVERIAAGIRPGMRESDAERLAAEVFAELGFERIWHPTHIRFGRNTLKLYKEASEPDVVLGEDDLFFIDIGPVWAGHEGDYGDTFCTGDAPALHSIAAAARTLFDQIAAVWRTGASGRELYHLAEQRALAAGYVLNLGAPGHRLGDFPHAVHKGGKLAAAEFSPAPGLWVLEIQIRHPSLPIGAFFEDLLLP